MVIDEVYRRGLPEVIRLAGSYDNVIRSIGDDSLITEELMLNTIREIVSYIDIDSKFIPGLNGDFGYLYKNSIYHNGMETRLSYKHENVVKYIPIIFKGVVRWYEMNFLHHIWNEKS
ncbi:hypothetical protein N9E79_01305 [bacterium]|nr:hypothetical protein [bacterium]